MNSSCGVETNAYLWLLRDYVNIIKACVRCRIRQVHVLRLPSRSVVQTSCTDVYMKWIPGKYSGLIYSAAGPVAIHLVFITVWCTTLWTEWNTCPALCPMCRLFPSYQYVECALGSVGQVVLQCYRYRLSQGCKNGLLLWLKPSRQPFLPLFAGCHGKNLYIFARKCSILAVWERCPFFMKKFMS